MKKLAILILTLSITSVVMGQSNATGYVFADGNKNGKKDRGEKGIAGVGVSNGREVTTTDATGKYSLPVGNDNIIFVIKPSGYDLPVMEKQLPLFYYIHKPGGSPTNTKYKGVAPTGALPKSVDFPLLPAAETKAFTTLIFGDPQPYTAEEVAYYAKGVVAEVAGVKNVAFGMSLGDLVGDSLDLHNPYIDATKAVGIPWFNVMGNHDMNYEAKADSLSDETFESNFGPANYSFNYGDVHFIVLDNIYYPDPRDGKSYWGGFREDQLQFVENDLKLVAKDKLVVVSFHIPLKDDSGVAFNLEHRQRLFNALKDFEHTLSLSAHTHLQRNDFFTAKQGWQRAKPHHEYNAGTTSGDWYSGAFDEKGVPVSTMRDGTPKGYAFIHFKGNSYSIDYKVVGKPADHQIALYAPKNFMGKRPGSAMVYANFFMGHKDSPVEIRFNNGAWKKMQVAETFDPSFTASTVLWDLSDDMPGNRRPSLPAQSTHLWQASFPKNMAPGRHTFEVRAKDMWGKTFTASQPFSVR